MKTVVLGSKGIGNAIVNSLLETHSIINISRSSPQFTHQNLTHHSCDVLSDDLPDLDVVDALIYCPGSINLKPISRLSLDDFRQDFENQCIGCNKSNSEILAKIKDWPSTFYPII